MEWNDDYIVESNYDDIPNDILEDLNVYNPYYHLISSANNACDGNRRNNSQNRSINRERRPEIISLLSDDEDDVPTSASVVSTTGRINSGEKRSALDDTPMEISIHEVRKSRKRRKLAEKEKLKKHGLQLKVKQEFHVVSVGFGEADDPPDLIEIKSIDETSTKQIIQLNESGDFNNVGTSEINMGAAALPHPRSDCVIFSYSKLNTSNENNNKYCKNCFCFICNIPASECKSWISFHSKIYKGNKQFEHLSKINQSFLLGAILKTLDASSINLKFGFQDGIFRPAPTILKLMNTKDLKKDLVIALGAKIKVTDDRLTPSYYITTNTDMTPFQPYLPSDYFQNEIFFIQMGRMNASVLNTIIYTNQIWYMKLKRSSDLVCGICNCRNETVN